MALVAHHIRRAYGPRVITVEVIASANDLNLRTLAGNPSGVVDVLCIVAPGVLIGSTSTLSPAFRTGSGWTAGSRLYVTNQGSIMGKGGDGNSGAGGDAMYLDYDMAGLDNSAGLIGGGGGGGGIGYSEGSPSPSLNGAAGGGGGGGRGHTASSGGNAASPYAVGGTNGNAGSSSAPGLGGGGGQNTLYGNLAGTGGSGGDLGEAGYQGDFGSSGFYGAAGGAAGYAIRLNAKSLTWIAGNDSTRVKGTVA